MKFEVCKFMRNKMKNSIILILAFIASLPCFSQNIQITGKLLEKENTPLSFATVVLKSLKDSSIVKVEATNDEGSFSFNVGNESSYFVSISYLGYKDFNSEVIRQTTNLGDILLLPNEEVMSEVTVKAQRSIIEVKPDRNIFNVQGTINSTGENGLTLLRKAPGVMLDNSNKISVLGRSGVLVYIDGKRIPLSNDELTSYLQSLTSDQIDRIEIITNPGAKYEAQGNAGIIDIRLKKDKNLGSNGSVSAGFGQGRRATYNAGINGNNKTKKVNLFGNANYNGGASWFDMRFKNYQNSLLLDEQSLSISEFNNYNGRVGLDYTVNKYSTIGFLVSTQQGKSNGSNDYISRISKEATSNKIDSILRAPNESEAERSQFAYNANYAYSKDKTNINFDIDYATYASKPTNFQPNYYYSDATSAIPRSSNITTYNSPSDINIFTLKLDLENKGKSGTLGYGAKFSQVSTDNKFDFFNRIDNQDKFNNRRSNQFLYDEKVTAAYVSYNGKINKTLNFVSGIRAEHTDAIGELVVYANDLKESPAEFDYVQFFPSAGLTYSKNPMHSYSLKFGRRINRPDYRVLNPFREQLSELSFQKGNKNLRPETVNNAEFSYTYKYMYNFSLSYSQTENQITRLIGPDNIDPRAGFISWDNLANQKLLSINASIPKQFTKKWSGYFNFSGNFTDNQADYGTNGGKVDVQVVSYSIYQQQTFDLGKKFKGELSGWFSGPGVWGGVFIYDPLGSLDIGMSKKLLNDKMNLRFSFSDIFFTSGWRGTSKFNGQTGNGRGNYDSRRASLNLTFDFGNSNVKSRKRSTSSNEELKRIQS
jgi:iron complex outermembrane recepter protein